MKKSPLKASFKATFYEKILLFSEKRLLFEKNVLSPSVKKACFGGLAKCRPLKNTIFQHFTCPLHGIFSQYVPGHLFFLKPRACGNEVGF